VLSVLAEKVKGFKYINSKLIGNFSFQKYPMVMDLNRIIEGGKFHQILAALAGDSATINDINEIGSENTLEALSNLNPIAENLIFPADSTQHQAISAVLGGKSVVIQGPPGSGKSQTIANLIAESVANKKTVTIEHVLLSETQKALLPIVNAKDKGALNYSFNSVYYNSERKLPFYPRWSGHPSHTDAPILAHLNRGKAFFYLIAYCSLYFIFY
jgi:hypothetical protein